MRFLVTVTWDIEAGNALAKSGNMGATVQAILEDLQPEAAYFTANQGKRTTVLVVDLADPSQMPAVAEPWFLAMNATVEFQPAMVPEDLAKAGPSIEQAVAKFG
jgi:hypothetical protein